MAWFDGLEAPPRVLIAPVESENEGCRDRGIGRSLCLRHPRSGKPTCYVLRCNSLQEIHWYKQSHASWFLGDYVCEDGSLYICTPVDPIFVFLPIFDAARMKKGSDQGVFRQLEEILYVEGFPGYQHLASLAKDSMSLVCEVKEIGSSKFFRLDNSKVLTWLCCKINHLKVTLSKLDKNYAAQEEKDALKDVVSILGEYLDESWLKVLCSHVQLDMEAVKEAPKAETIQQFQVNPMESSNSLQGKVGNGKGITSTKRQTKKQKIESEPQSQNIMSMFSRVTRSKK